MAHLLPELNVKVIVSKMSWSTGKGIPTFLERFCNGRLVFCLQLVIGNYASQSLNILHNILVNTFTFRLYNANAEISQEGINGSSMMQGAGPISTRGLWGKIKSHLQPPEIDPVRQAIGLSLIDGNEELWKELASLEEILKDLQLEEEDEEDEERNQHPIRSNAINPSPSHTLVCPPSSQNLGRAALEDEIRHLLAQLENQSISLRRGRLRPASSDGHHRGLTERERIRKKGLVEEGWKSERESEIEEYLLQERGEKGADNYKNATRSRIDIDSINKLSETLMGTARMQQAFSARSSSSSRPSTASSVACRLAPAHLELTHLVGGEVGLQRLNAFSIDQVVGRLQAALREEEKLLIEEIEKVTLMIEEETFLASIGRRRGACGSRKGQAAEKGREKEEAEDDCRLVSSPSSSARGNDGSRRRPNTLPTTAELRQYKTKLSHLVSDQEHQEDLLAKLRLGDDDREEEEGVASPHSAYSSATTTPSLSCRVSPHPSPEKGGNERGNRGSSPLRPASHHQHSPTKHSSNPSHRHHPSSSPCRHATSTTSSPCSPSPHRKTPHQRPSKEGRKGCSNTTTSANTRSYYSSPIRFSSSCSPSMRIASLLDDRREGEKDGEEEEEDSSPSRRSLREKLQAARDEQYLLP